MLSRKALKNEITHSVLMRNPRTMIEARSLARVQELKFSSQICHHLLLRQTRLSNSSNSDMGISHDVPKQKLQVPQCSKKITKYTIKYSI